MSNEKIARGIAAEAAMWCGMPPPFAQVAEMVRRAARDALHVFVASLVKGVLESPLFGSQRRKLAVFAASLAYGYSDVELDPANPRLVPLLAEIERGLPLWQASGRLRRLTEGSWREKPQ